MTIGNKSHEPNGKISKVIILHRPKEDTFSDKGSRCHSTNVIQTHICASQYIWNKALQHSFQKYPQWLNHSLKGYTLKHKRVLRVFCKSRNALKIRWWNNTEINKEKIFPLKTYVNSFLGNAEKLCLLDGWKNQRTWHIERISSSRF